KLSNPEPDPDELSFNELRRFTGHTASEQNDAAIIFHKRLAFALSPFVFSIFGAALALRMRRGGRAFGVVVSLLILLLYYIVALGGDHAARAGSVSPALGAWSSTVLMLVVGLWLLIRGQKPFSLRLPRRQTRSAEQAQHRSKKASILRRRLSLASFPMLLDVAVVRTLIVSFAF